MIRKRFIALALIAATLSAGLGLISSPAQACGREDYVCDVIEYGRDRACVKFHICL